MEFQFLLYYLSSMEIEFTDDFSHEQLRDNSVIRHHIWPGHVIVGFMVAICHCNNRLNNGYDYCANCGFAIPTEKEKEIFKVK